MQQFFSVKCSEGLLGPITLIMDLKLDPCWKDFSPSLNWTETGLKICWFSSYLQAASISEIPIPSHILKPPKAGKQQPMLYGSYSATALPAWRALISAGALLCKWMLYGLSSLSRAMGAGELKMGSLQRLPVSFWENGYISRCQVYLGAKSSQERLKPATCWSIVPPFWIYSLQFLRVFHLG